MKELKHRIPKPPTRERIRDIEGMIEAKTDCLIFNMAAPARIPACFKSIPTEEVAYVFKDERESSFGQNAMMLFLPCKARPYYTLATLGFSERRELVVSAVELVSGLVKLLFKLMKMPAEKKRKLKYGSLIKSNFTEADYYDDPGDFLVVPAVDGYAPKTGKGNDGVTLMQLISNDVIGIRDMSLTPEDISKRLRVDMISQPIDGPRIFSLAAKGKKRKR